MSRIETLLSLRLALRKAQAITRAKHAVDNLMSEGIETFVIGSLASGHFMTHSDVDFFVTTPVDRQKRVQTEAIVSRAMARSGIGFDIIYAEDVRSECLPEFCDAKLDASDLFELANKIGQPESGNAKPH
jgi:predicted nucleotidyltransferase